ncbi:granulocyte colony-stimulating factor receptor-like [Trichomycterus rosablanca]|uniref:granulocyte colony-stimulating factor receptor-like n=1 Tax=Trichomycterus rosablanca TaxID=2290929 RepID=UPI002F353F19
MIHNFEVYTGTITPAEGKPDIGASGNIVLKLCSVIPTNQSFKLFFDNWFCSIDLQVQLERMKIHSVGTVRSKRLPNCTFTDDKTMKKKGRGTFEEKETKHDAVYLRAVKWYDNRSVILLSTYAAAHPTTLVQRWDKKTQEMVEVVRPNIVSIYNKSMGGVDILDSLIALYRTKVRSKKWYHHLFFHMMDMIMVEAWLLYRRDSIDCGVEKKEQLSLLDFKSEVAGCLCKKDTVCSKRGRPSLSVEAGLDLKRRRGQVAPVPPAPIRLDRIDHWSVYSENRGRCQELCNVSPKNSIVPYGSDVVVFYKAPFNSNCRNWTNVNLQEVYWKLNNRIIDSKFYQFNSTFSSVLISNLSVEKARVECYLDGLVLDGTFIRTCCNPQNVSCIAKVNYMDINIQVTCTWDDQNTADTKYTVHYKVSNNNEDISECRGKICKFSVLFTMGSLSVTVSAESPAGQSHSDQVFYESILTSIVQIDPPIDVQVAPKSNVLSVTWKHEDQPRENDWECEVRLHENGSYAVPVMKHVIAANAYELTEVKPCTYYNVSVRCKLRGTIWSEWSKDVTAVTSVNVSAVQIQLFRPESILRDDGTRTVHLMWKAVPLSCEAFIEYRVCHHNSRFVKSRCFNTSRNHEFITVDEHAHMLTVTALYNKTSLNEASIEVPSTAEDVNLPPVGNVSVFVQHREIHLTWMEPSTPVSGYIIVWNSTGTNHMWQHSRETSFTLKGEPFTLYTISLSPVYENGPGKEARLHKYAEEGNLTKVATLKVTAISDRKAEISWSPILSTQCCAFVVNYTVFYIAHNKSKPRSVTVSEKQHSVILEDLQPSTAYTVFIMAGSRSSTSKSEPITFSTKPYSEFFLTVIIGCGVGLTMLPVLAVLALMIRKKYLSVKIPNPGHGTLSVWLSENAKKPWIQTPLPLDSDSDNIVPCQGDNKVISNFPASNTVPASLRKSTNDQNIAAQKWSSETRTTALIVSHGKQRPVIQPLPAVDVWSFEYHHLPPVQSPYRQQTPLNSPVESPTKPPFLDETEMLLKPSPKSTTTFTTYVTIDFLKTSKAQTK